MIPATPEATRLLTFISASTAQSGVCPSYAEMADHLGLKSKSGVHRMICQLEERGLIRRLAFRDRAIEVVLGQPVVLPTDLYLEAHTAARRGGCTVNALAVTALRAWLDSE